MKLMLALMIGLSLAAGVMPQSAPKRRREHKPASQRAVKDKYPDIEDFIIPIPEWVKVIDQENYVHSYRSINISRPSQGVVRAWTKHALKVVSQQARDAHREKHNLRASKFATFTHTLYLKDFNCAARQVRLLQVAYYGYDGQYIDGESFDDSAWEHVLPDSVGETMMEEVCKHL